MAISAFYGLWGTRSSWGGIPVYPGGFDGFGGDVLGGHAEHFKADVVLVLGDAFAQNPEILAGLKSVIWAPVDCTPLSARDREALGASRARVVAMSRHGERELAAAGFAPWYVPHGVPVNVFKPAGKHALRKAMGLPDGIFVVGVNAANKDPVRKGFFEQMAAFAQFHERHPGTLLLVHTTPASITGGQDLTAIARHLGIQDAVRWADPYCYAAGTYSPQDMAAWYNVLDLYSGCSWGEGFGLPLIEAQSCGIPVVTTAASATAELAGPGWAVSGERYWHDGHEAEWVKPSIAGIAAAYEDAWNGKAASLRKAAREFALQYDADRVLTQFWKPVLEEIEAEAKGGDWHRIRRYAGLKWLVDDPHPTGDMLALGHEGMLDQFVLDLLPEGGVFCDVGAHVGHYTLRAARKALKVIAVEANPATAARLRSNLALNVTGNVTVHEVAAWDEHTQLTLDSPSGHERDGSTRVTQDGTGERVPAVPLDGLLADEPRIDLVKLDVEGADLHALAGMRATLARCRPILFIEDHSVYGYYQREDLNALLTGLGYRWRDFPAYRGYVIAEPEASDGSA